MAISTSTLTAPDAVIYRTRDGRPRGETDKHRELMAYLIAALKVHFMGQPEVYVSGNNFVFWEEGSPKSRISPDAYVVVGVEDRLRDSYFAWKEGGLLPSVIIEITSRSPQSEDIETKLPLYEQTWKTPEYFLFDPTGGYLKPRLQGYRLENGQHVRLEPRQGRLHSRQLELDFVPIGETLRLYNPVSGEFLSTPQEQAERVEAEARRAETEARRAENAEAEIARLRAEIEALRKKAAIAMEDAPYTLNIPEEQQQRLEMLSSSHMKPLTDYLASLRNAFGEHYHIPNFDPGDGGTQAGALFLLEAPGPKAKASGFVSSNNPDPTAKNLWNLIHNAGIARADTLIWNIVPWYVGTGKHILPVNNADRVQALPYLEELLALLPNLQLIVLVGLAAQAAAPHIRLLTSLPIKHTYHMSGQVFNRWPDKKKQTEEDFQAVAEFLSKSK